VVHSANLPTDTTQYLTADFGLRPPLPSNLDSTIGDLVWIDRNSDGVYEVGEPTIPGVTVRLYRDLGTIGVLDPADELIGNQPTDADGNYQFTGLAAGDYLVAVDTGDPDFPSGLILGLGSPAQPNPEAVSLGSLVDRMDVDFGFNYNGSIGDLVWYDNNGNGVPDGGENGVAGASVLLYEDTDGDGNFNGATDVQIDEAVTDANGAYVFQGLPPGTYFVKVYEQSVMPEGDPNGVPNLMPTTPSRVKVDLDPGEQFVTADFGFKRGSTIEGSVYWDINHNSVIDPGDPVAPESGLAGITVWIDANGDGILNWTDADNDGSWDPGEG
jgi:hypothetical protein